MNSSALCEWRALDIFSHDPRLEVRINWEGCVTKGILRKNGGDGRGGGTN